VIKEMINMDDKLKNVLDTLDEKETDRLLKDIDAKDTGGLNVENIMKRVYEGTGVSVDGKSAADRVVSMSESGKGQSEKAVSGDPREDNTPAAAPDRKEQETETHNGRVIPWKIMGLVASLVVVFISGFLLRGVIGGKDGSMMDGAKNEYAASDVAEINETAKNPETENYDDGGVDTAAEEYKAGDEDSEQAAEESTEDSGKSERTDEKIADSDRDNNNKDKKDGNNSRDNKDNKDNKGTTGNDRIDSIAAGTDSDSIYIEMSSDEVDQLLYDSDDEIDMDAEVSGYASLEDMIAHSDYIVRGVKSGSSLRRTDKKHHFKLVSDFIVKNVIYDGDGSEDLSDIIRVEEGIIYNSKRECYRHIYGYARMKLGGEYVLFLKKTGKYLSVAEVIFGKVPVDKSEDVMCLDSSYIPSQKVMNAKNIIEKARSRYIDGPNVITHEDKKDKPDNTQNSNKNKMDKADKSEKSSTVDDSDDSMSDGENDTQKEDNSKSDKSDNTDNSQNGSNENDADKSIIE
jgi:hypothetical protein